MRSVAVERVTRKVFFTSSCLYRIADLADVQKSRSLLLDRGGDRFVQGSARLEQSIERRRALLHFSCACIVCCIRLNSQREFG